MATIGSYVLVLSCWDFQEQLRDVVFQEEVHHWERAMTFPRILFSSQCFSISPHLYSLFSKRDVKIYDIITSIHRVEICGFQMYGPSLFPTKERWVIKFYHLDSSVQMGRQKYKRGKSDSSEKYRNIHVQILRQWEYCMNWRKSRGLEILLRDSTMAKHRHTFENFNFYWHMFITYRDEFLRIFSWRYNHWPYYPHHNSFVSLPIQDPFPKTILLLYSHHKYLKSFLYLCKLYSLQMMKTVKYIFVLYKFKYQLPCNNNFMPSQ